MADMIPLGNIILTCSGEKCNGKCMIQGISFASFTNPESTIAILRKAADLLEEGKDGENIQTLFPYK